mgnify:CR=1 FL=1
MDRAPGITAATAPAELAQFFFTKSITLGATPTAANILVAADDFAEVLVNGTVVGTTGSTTDIWVASLAANSLKSFNILPHLTAGANTITIRGQNGTGALASCTNCTYQQAPAGILVSGEITVGGGAVTGACCDHDPFGGCTDGVSQTECDCGRCEWTEDALCDDVECPRDSIPTVGAWGLAVLTLLLLTGAKVAFARRTPATLPW